MQRNHRPRGGFRARSAIRCIDPGKRAYDDAARETEGVAFSLRTLELCGRLSLILEATPRPANSPRSRFAKIPGMTA